MHFKSAVILCALYFLKSSRSIGLSDRQLSNITSLYETYKAYNEYDENYIIRTMKELYGIEEPKSILEYNSDVPDYINFKEFVLALACKSYVSYEDERKILTCFEVEFFLGVFIEHVANFNQDGHLTLQQLPGLLKDLKLGNGTIVQLVHQVKTENKNDFVINAAYFLMLMLEIKPEGYGLNLKQIKMFVNLYDVHKTESGSIDPLEIQKIFKEFNMTATKHEPKLFFQSNRSAEKELMELMIVTAQRSRALHTDEEEFLDPSDVMLYIGKFICYDKDKNGLLSNIEWSTWKKSLLSKLKQLSASDYESNSLSSEQFQNEIINSIKAEENIDNKNVAKFLKITFFYIIIT